MRLRPEEITSVIRKELQGFQAQLHQESIGTVIQVGDGIARIHGLDDAMIGELVEFPKNVMGMVANLEEDSVSAVIFGPDNPEKNITEGDEAKRTGKVVQVPVGDALLGRVVNALGAPIDGQGPIQTTKFRSLEVIVPNVIQRQPVKESLETGIKAIDAMIPIGHGQRELIIGDRQTGKTAIAIDTIINQKGKGVYCIYVAIGQKISNVVAISETLNKIGAMKYTTIVSASSRASASQQYLAPYAATSMAEEWMYEGKKVLVVYDDLTKHAQAYRQLSLLMRRPPGREAYPGDIFYIHSRLLERSAKLCDEMGGGSITALPIIETQAGDITSYIPTNVISITDGQIYLETDMFYNGIRPAVNVGLSVSRVGGKAQTKAIRQVAAKLRLDLAQYNELAAFTQFGSEMDKNTQAQLTRGKVMIEVLKQTQYAPLPLSREVLIIYSGIRGFLDDLDLSMIHRFEVEFFKYVAKNHPDIEQEINTQKQLSDELAVRMDQAILTFKEEFIQSIKK